MEKFKNFLYNKNDIIIALLIVLLAAIVIFFSLKAILEWPDKMLEQVNSTSKIVEPIINSIVKL